MKTISCIKELETDTKNLKNDNQKIEKHQNNLAVGKSAFHMPIEQREYYLKNICALSFFFYKYDFLLVVFLKSESLNTGRKKLMLKTQGEKNSPATLHYKVMGVWDYYDPYNFPLSVIKRKGKTFSHIFIV